MSSEQGKGKKRNKAFYRKSAFNANKKQRTGSSNRLEPGQKGFLVMCNNNESSAVREAYNILNDYADLMFGQGKSGAASDAQSSQTEQCLPGQPAASESCSDEESDEDFEDIEKALQKEVDSMKSKPNEERRFQNCATKAKNCVFIRTTVSEPVKLVLSIMEDIAEKRVNRARYAARILPIIGTCKAHTGDIEQLAKKIFTPFFSADNPSAPSSFTVLFKTRNNNTTTCGKTIVIPAVSSAVKEINPKVVFSWSDFDVAILVEIVCTVCCLGVAPEFTKLRKYNLQELVQGARASGDGGNQGGDGKKEGDDARKEESMEKTSSSSNGQGNVTVTNTSSSNSCENEVDETSEKTESVVIEGEVVGDQNTVVVVSGGKDTTECENTSEAVISDQSKVSPNCPLDIQQSGDIEDSLVTANVEKDLTQVNEKCDKVPTTVTVSNDDVLL